jgi:hypothetical protein
MDDDIATIVGIKFTLIQEDEKLRGNVGRRITSVWVLLI